MATARATTKGKLDFMLIANHLEDELFSDLSLHVERSVTKPFSVAADRSISISTSDTSQGLSMSCQISASDSFDLDQQIVPANVGDRVDDR